MCLDLPVMNEELFGPSFQSYHFRKIEDAIQIIQKKEKPLALYILANEKNEFKKILKTLLQWSRN